MSTINEANRDFELLKQKCKDTDVKIQLLRESDCNDTMTEEYQIKCPNCGCTTWKLYIRKHETETYSFRVACANGCYVDNVYHLKRNDTVYDVLKESYGLIEADREFIEKEVGK